MRNTVVLCLSTCNSLWQGLASKMLFDGSISGICICTDTEAVLPLFSQGSSSGRDLRAKETRVLFKHADSQQLLCSRRPGTVGESWQRDQAQLFCAVSDHSVGGGSSSQPSGGIHVKSPEEKCFKNGPAEGQLLILSLLLPPTDFSGQF